MKEQPRRNADTDKKKTDIDLTVSDTDADDFFDLPPYEPHVSSPHKVSPTKAPPAAKANRPAWSRHLLTLGVACIVTAAVVWIAHAAATNVPPVDDSEQPPAQSGENIDQQQPPASENDPDSSMQTPPPRPAYTYACDVSAFMSAIEYAPEKDDILLLNKTHSKGAGYAPSSLSELAPSYTLYGKEVLLESTAAAALEAMLLCMRADGITDTYATSGYRSYTYQSQLFALYVEREMNSDPTLSRERATEIVETYSSRPGQSEHQSGLCVDLMTTTMGNLDESFENTAAFPWLQENAGQFGFILRYPKGMENITGYTYEPWHYRFVGRAAALEISAAGITLEEYLGQMQ
ncbi:MAG: M15 family metallopeptidase [Clostridia bacterium]|nr:M15 family metallopeptidase [Clostridia bacterium]